MTNQDCSNEIIIVTLRELARQQEEWHSCMETARVLRLAADLIEDIETEPLLPLKRVKHPGVLGTPCEPPDEPPECLVFVLKGERDSLRKALGQSVEINGGYVERIGLLVAETSELAKKNTELRESLSQELERNQELRDLLVAANKARDEMKLELRRVKAEFGDFRTATRAVQFFEGMQPIPGNLRSVGDACYRLATAIEEGNF